MIAAGDMIHEVLEETFIKVLSYRLTIVQLPNLVSIAQDSSSRSLGSRVTCR
jgi:hypothetical protein